MSFPNGSLKGSVKNTMDNHLTLGSGHNMFMRNSLPGVVPQSVQHKIVSNAIKKEEPKHYAAKLRKVFQQDPDTIGLTQQTATADLHSKRSGTHTSHGSRPPRSNKIPSPPKMPMNNRYNEQSANNNSNNNSAIV